MSAMQAYVARDRGLIRYSAILRSLEEHSTPEIVEKFKAAVNEINRVCETHGYLVDPVIGVDYEENLVAVACPYCSGGEVLARWEAQEVEA